MKETKMKTTTRLVNSLKGFESNVSDIIRTAEMLAFNSANMLDIQRSYQELLVLVDALQAQAEELKTAKGESLTAPQGRDVRPPEMKFLKKYL